MPAVLSLNWFKNEYSWHPDSNYGEYTSFKSIEFDAFKTIRIHLPGTFICEGTISLKPPKWWSYTKLS